ncbi:MAG: phytanoyl-CoA dioxygenase family protein [Rhodospirillales bacterium]|nr:phytanoyl-CoA dioxygenase family protein [Rhodospirillales bacterium]
MSALVSLPRMAPADDALEVLARDGCVILERLAGAATVDAVAADLAPDIAATPTGTGEFVGHHTRRTHTVLVNSPTAGALALHPAVATLNDAVLGPYCARYQLSSAAAITIGPGETMQELHRDDLVYPLAHPCERQSVVTVIWAIDEFTAANGATLVVPGSHRWDDERKPRLAEAVPAEMPQGSAVYILGSTYHAGGANRTEHARSGLLYGYCLGWLRQEQNQYLAVPPDIARTLPEPLQRLIGYAVHEPFLGWHDLQDPIELLRGYEDQSAGARDLIPEGQAAAVQGKQVKRS